MSGRYSINGSRSLSALSGSAALKTPSAASLKAPIHNPYDKFSGAQFDAFISDITGALRGALGGIDYEVQKKQEENEKKVASTASPRSDSNADPFEAGDSISAVLRRQRKGKERDPAEGPGLFAESGDLEEDPIGVDDSDEEVEESLGARYEDEEDRSASDSVSDDGEEGEEMATGECYADEDPEEPRVEDEYSDEEEYEDEPAEQHEDPRRKQPAVMRTSRDARYEEDEVAEEEDDNEYDEEEGSFADDNEQHQYEQDADSDGSARSESRSPEAEVIDLLSDDDEELDGGVGSGRQGSEESMQYEDDEPLDSRSSPPPIAHSPLCEDRSPDEDEEDDQLTPQVAPGQGYIAEDMRPFVASRSTSPSLQQPLDQEDPWDPLRLFAEDFYAGGDNIGNSLTPEQVSAHQLSGDDRFGTPMGVDVDEPTITKAPFGTVFQAPKEDAPAMYSYRWAMPSPPPNPPSLDQMRGERDEDTKVEEQHLSEPAQSDLLNPIALPEDFKLGVSEDADPEALIEAIQFVSVPDYVVSQPSDGDDDSQSEDEDEGVRFPPLGTSDLDHDAYPPRASDVYFSDEDADADLDARVEEAEEEDQILDMDTPTDRPEPVALHSSHSPRQESVKEMTPELEISGAPVLETASNLPVDELGDDMQTDAVAGDLAQDGDQEGAVDALKSDRQPAPDLDTPLPSIVVDEIPALETATADPLQILPPVCADPDMLDPVEYSPEPEFNEFMVPGLFTPANNMSLPDSPAASGPSSQNGLDELLDRVLAGSNALAMFPSPAELAAEDELLERPTAADTNEDEREETTTVVSVEESTSISTTHVEVGEDKRDMVLAASSTEETTTVVTQQVSPEDTTSILPAANGAALLPEGVAVEDEEVEVEDEQSNLALEDQVLGYPVDASASPGPERIVSGELEEDPISVSEDDDDEVDAEPELDAEHELDADQVLDAEQALDADQVLDADHELDADGESDDEPDADQELDGEADLDNQADKADGSDGWTTLADADQHTPDPSDPNEDPFRLMGTNSTVAPGEVHDDTPKEEISPPKLIDDGGDAEDTPISRDTSTPLAEDASKVASPRTQPLEDDELDRSIPTEEISQLAPEDEEVDSPASTPSDNNRDVVEAPVDNRTTSVSIVEEEAQASAPEDRQDDSLATTRKEAETEKEETELSTTRDYADPIVSSRHSEAPESEIIEQADTDTAVARPAVFERSTSSQSLIPTGDQARSSKRKRQDSDGSSLIPRPKLRKNASSRSVLSTKDKDKGKERQRSGSPASSSGASAASKLLKPSSIQSSRASSVAPQEDIPASPSVNEGGSQDTQMSVLLHKHRPNPVRHHSHLPTLIVQSNQQRQAQSQQQAQQGSSQKPPSQADNADSPTTPSTSTPAHQPNYTPARVEASGRGASGSSPVTRSNCRFRRISVPREEGGPRVYFIIPGCSLNDKELMDDEEIADHGDATISDSRRMVSDVGTLDFVSEYLLGVLRQLVGLDLLREQEVYYLPQPGEEIRRRAANVSKASLGRRATRESFGSGPSVYGSTPSETAYSPRKSSSLRPPQSGSINSISTGSTSAKSKKLRRTLRYSASVSSAELDQHSDTDDAGPAAKKPKLEQEASEPGSSQATTVGEGKKKGVRRKRLTSEAAAYTPGEDEDDKHEEDDLEEQEQKKRKKKRGVKRTRTSEIPPSPLATNSGDVNPRKTKRQRSKRTVDKDAGAATVTPDATADTPQVEE